VNAKRTPLSGLGARLAKKPTEAVETLSTQPDPAVGASAGVTARPPDGRKGILVRARPEAWKSLKLVALDLEMTLQDVMTEAINDVLTKHGRPPTA